MLLLLHNNNNNMKVTRTQHWNYKIVRLTWRLSDVAWCRTFDSSVFLCVCVFFVSHKGAIFIRTLIFCSRFQDIFYTKEKLHLLSVLSSIRLFFFIWKTFIFPGIFVKRKHFSMNFFNFNFFVIQIYFRLKHFV